MARIAEELLLLLLDNESAQPLLDRNRRGRLLAAALLLDLAYDCRVRPAVAGDPVPPGHLIALAGPPARDPAVRPALALLEQGPLTPRAAIARVRKHAEDDVLDQLLRTGQIHQRQLSSHRLRRNTYTWPLSDTRRVGDARATIHAVLFEHRRPDPVTAVVIALLYRCGALTAVLGFSEDGARAAATRAEEITFTGWGPGPDTGEVNLAMTAAAVLPALN